jgi:hypothetical protein
MPIFGAPFEGPKEGETEEIAFYLGSIDLSQKDCWLFPPRTTVSKD